MQAMIIMLFSVKLIDSWVNDMASHRASEQQVWDFFVALFDGNEYAAAGACGNMQAESALYSDNCENKWNDRWYTDEQATEWMNDGTWNLNHFLYGSNTATSPIARWWVNAYGWGYGLSQWTTTSRRTRLWELTIDMGYDIDDVDRQLAYIDEEFHGAYDSVRQAMINATSIEQATLIYCNRYEIGQWSSARLTNAEYFYTTYSGSGGGTYLVTINIDGNGDAFANEHLADLTTRMTRFRGDQDVFIHAIPNGSDTFINWTVDSGGVTIDMDTNLNTFFTMHPNAVTITAHFTGDTPTPPTPTPIGNEDEHHMPIWMYPMFRL